MAMRIILGEDYVDYQSACHKFGALTLDEKRTNLCYKFARKNLKVKIPSSLKLAQMFKPDKKVIKSESSNVTLPDSRKLACLIWQNS